MDMALYKSYVLLLLLLDILFSIILFYHAWDNLLKILSAICLLLASVELDEI